MRYGHISYGILLRLRCMACALSVAPQAHAVQAVQKSRLHPFGVHMRTVAKETAQQNAGAEIDNLVPPPRRHKQHVARG